MVLFNQIVPEAWKAAIKFRKLILKNFKSCSILPVNSVIEFLKLLFMRNYSQENLPNSFLNTWIINDERRIDLNLRPHDGFFTPMACTLTSVRLPLHAYQLPGIVFKNLLSKMK
jgi:hypothetical protein